MKWLVIVTTMIVCLSLAACGGSDGSTKGSAANPTGDSGQAQQQVSNSISEGGDAQQDQTSSNDGDETDLNCPQFSYSGFKTKEEAALGAACHGADFDGLSVVYRRLEVEKESGRNATIRVVGFVEVCSVVCPQEQETTIDVFINSSGKWESDNIYPNFTESKESKEAKTAKRTAELGGITVMVSNKHPTLDFYGEFLDPVRISTDDPTVAVQLQVELPDGRTGVIYQAGLQYNAEFRFSPSPSLKFGSYDQGWVVTVNAYRVYSFDVNTVPVFGDWHPVN